MVYIPRGALVATAVFFTLISSGHAQNGRTMQARQATDASNGDTAATKVYLITSVDNTSKEKFLDFAGKPPLAGKRGDIISDPDVEWVSYQVFDLSDADAETVRKDPIVLFANPITEDDGQALVLPNQDHDTRTLNKRDLPQSLNQRDKSDYHLGLLSARNQKNDPTKLPNYVFEPTLGKGQTIYVIDTGYRADHPDFDKSEREVREFVVPNRYTLDPWELARDIQAPEDMTDINGHGTLVASIAAGYTHGVASLANLVIVKFRNSAQNPLKPDDKTLKPRGVSDSALEAAYQWIFGDIARQKKKEGADPNAKFVINMSYGWVKTDPPHTGKRATMEHLLKKVKDRDITLVVAAGNEGETHTLDQITPQDFGTDERFNFITVGGVDKQGKYYIKTTNKKDANSPGKVDIYAGAVDVTAAKYDEAGDSSTTDTGTSLAAPAVAGLATYFFGIPELRSNFRQGSESADMKAFLIKNSEVRNDNPFNDGDRFPGSPKPDAAALKVPYNLALNQLCDISEAATKRSIFDKRALDPNASVPGRTVVENGAVKDNDLKNEICAVHGNAGAAGGDGGDPPQVDPPTKAYAVGPSGAKWAIFEHDKGTDIDTCNPGTSILSNPPDAGNLLDLTDEDSVRLGPFDLPNSYTTCNFVANKATEGGDILCNKQPKVPCTYKGLSSFSGCLGNDNTFQAVWDCSLP